MAAEQLTLETLERTASFKSDDQLDCEVYSPLFDKVVPTTIYFDGDKRTVSRRQLRALNQFAELKDGFDHIKSELFSHWDNNSDTFDFVCENAEHAFENASFNWLLINSERYWGDIPCSMLRFRVEWDTEHGAGIFVVNGKLSHFADSFDWPVIDARE